MPLSHRLWDVPGCFLVHFAGRNRHPCRVLGGPLSLVFVSLGRKCGCTRLIFHSRRTLTLETHPTVTSSSLSFLPSLVVACDGHRSMASRRRLCRPAACSMTASVALLPPSMARSLAARTLARFEDACAAVKDDEDAREKRAKTNSLRIWGSFPSLREPSLSRMPFESKTIPEQTETEKDALRKTTRRTGWGGSSPVRQLPPPKRGGGQSF
eukprot:scaffold102_cov340-Pavlova_lutheri.AAC.83